MGLLFREKVAMKARRLMLALENDPAMLESQMLEARRILSEAGLLPRSVPASLTEKDRFLQEAFEDNGQIENQKLEVRPGSIRAAESLPELAHALAPHISPD
jgi:hypothetical protein